MTTPYDASQAQGYDDRAPKAVPGYDVLQSMTLTLLSSELPKEAWLLVAGAGTGNEILRLAQAQPQWRFTAVEPAEAMAEVGRRKAEAAGLGDRVVWHVGTLDTLDPDVSFDAATALLVLHFVEDKAKESFLEEICARLAPGAPLVLASFFGDPEATRTKKLFDWSQSWSKTAGLSEEEAAKRISLANPALSVVAEDQLKVLFRNAGFIDFQRFFQTFATGAWLARAPR